RALAARIGPAAGQEPGPVRHETLAGEGVASGADVARRGVRGRPGERPGVRSFGEWENAPAVRDRPGTGAIRSEGPVRRVQPAGAGPADRQARPASERSLEETGGL